MAKDEGINASGSLGVQVGSGNIQHNYYRPPDHSFLSTLSPHKALARLRGMPHDDAVSALASVPPSDVVDVLKADKALTVALLADLNPRRAKELTALLETDWPWLALLPEAAAAIARRASELRWDHDGSAGFLEHVNDTHGPYSAYIQKYPEGYIGFRNSATHIITGIIAEIYTVNGGPNGHLQFPAGEESPAESQFGTRGTVQEFTNGVVFASPHGTFIVSGNIDEEYFENQDDFHGRLGFPIANGEDHEGHRLQRFEGGAIFSSEAGTFAVRQAIFGEFADDEIPVSAEVEVTSPLGTTGQTQESRTGGAEDVLTCSSEAHGTHFVTGPMLKHYRELGGAESWLGFPLSGSGGRNRVQQFEGGAIYRTPFQAAPVAAPAETVRLISEAHNGDLLGCGLPVTEEQSIGTDSGDRIQFFEEAVVTLRDGRRELWPRPAEA